MRRFLNCSLRIPHCELDMAHQCMPKVHRRPSELHECYNILYNNGTNIDNLKPTLWNSTVWEGVVKPSLKTFRTCHRQRWQVIRSCAKLLQQDCLKASVRSLKEIRLDFRFVVPLLQLDPEIRVIHLVRDPRGLLASTSNVPIVSHMCDRMLIDIRAYRRTVEKYPRCCIQIRYEDLTSNPKEIASQVYKHLGIDFHKYYRDWQLKINNPYHNDGAMGTYRQNMSAEAFDWKFKLVDFQLDKLKQVKSCVKVIQLLGYEAV